MPRADTKAQSYYQSSFPNGVPYPALSDSLSSHLSSSTSVGTAQKKKHVCPICERSFSTSGHLSRHARVHTGERNHKCPFPGCETRCSRQDNLQQHYRIHLSPGSRRNSKSRVLATPAKRNSTLVEPPLSPPLSPPRLEPARIYISHSPPPDSPPPLAQATLPATAHPADSLSTPSPDSPYSAVSQHSLTSSGLSTHYNYTPGPSYDEPSQFSYVDDSSSSSNGAFSSYNSSQEYETHPLPHLNTVIPHPSNSHSPSPVSSISMGSRHSIAHISHPYNGTNPPSPTSSHSVSSHPSTPTYPVYENEYHQHGNSSILTDQHSLSGSHLSQHPNTHPAYSSPVTVQPSNQTPPSRYQSPPPILAPLQGNANSGHTHYLHHSQTTSGGFGGYRQSHHDRHAINLGHEAWKTHGFRSKGIEALVL